MIQLHIAGSSDVSGVTYYNVQLSGHGQTWSVQRRYNDFVELDRRLTQDDSLTRRILPGKDIFGIMKAWDIGRFGQRRQDGLEQYLRHLLSQATAMRNSAFAQFLECPFSIDRVQSFAEPGASSALLQNIMQAMSNAQAQVAQQHAIRMQELTRTEDEERTCFRGVFESKYGMDPPDVFEGTFAEAVAIARVERRLLLVWLYDSGPVSDALCREVLGGQVFKAFASEYFFLWPGDAERWALPMQLRSLFRLTSLPSLLVLKPLSVYDVPEVADPSTGLPVEFPIDTAWQLLGAWDATSSGVDEQLVVNFLAEHGERATEEIRLLEEERRFQQEYAEEARALREQQDREVEESAQKDRERAEAAELERQAAEQEQMRADAELEKKAAIEAAAASKKEALAEARRKAAAGYLGEHSSSADRVCKIVLRLPNGRRVERKFDADDRLAVVYEWADCCGELSGLQGGEVFEIPCKFHLATTYPRTALTDQAQSLRELQLLPNALLALNPEDE